MARQDYSTAERVLEAYAGDEQEPWKEDHGNAMACRNLEEKIRVGNVLFGMVTQISDRHLSSPESQEDPAPIENLFRWWLKPCDRIKARIERFEGVFKDGVEGADEFRQNCEAATLFLKRYAMLLAGEARVGYRNVDLTDEAAQVLRTILDDRSSSTGRLTSEAREVPLSEPSLLKRRERR